MSKTAESCDFDAPFGRRGTSRAAGFRRQRRGPASTETLVFGYIDHVKWFQAQSYGTDPTSALRSAHGLLMIARPRRISAIALSKAMCHITLSSNRAMASANRGSRRRMKVPRRALLRSASASTHRHPRFISGERCVVRFPNETDRRSMIATRSFVIRTTRKSISVAIRD